MSLSTFQLLCLKRFLLSGYIVWLKEVILKIQVPIYSTVSCLHIEILLTGIPAIGISSGEKVTFSPREMSCMKQQCPGPFPC